VFSKDITCYFVTDNPIKKKGSHQFTKEKFKEKIDTKVIYIHCQISFYVYLHQL